MVKVTFVAADGQNFEVEGEAGTTLMDLALDNMIPEIEGQCGGGCACATCHCYPRDEWTEKLTSKSDLEDMTLEGGTAEIKKNSRLACQVVLSDDVSGLVVDLPEPAF